MPDQQQINRSGMIEIRINAYLSKYPTPTSLIWEEVPVSVVILHRIYNPVIHYSSYPRILI